MGSIKGQKHNPYIQGKYGHLNPNDVVFTPRELAKTMCESLPIMGKCLEPCKGEGVFMEFLPPNTDWCEITEGRNFFDYTKKVDWIVTNPPYSDFNRFLEHSFELADNVALLVPVAKVFKSMGTLKTILNYGGFVSIQLLPASKAGFPFGFPCACVHMKRGFEHSTKIQLMVLDTDNSNSREVNKEPK